MTEELTLTHPTAEAAPPKAILTLIGNYAPEDLLAFKKLWEREFGRSPKPLIMLAATDATAVPVGPITVEVRRLPIAGDLPLPRRTTTGAACYDVYAAEDVAIPSGETRSVPTGLCFAVPDGWEMQVRSRSGLAAKNRVHVLNSPGTLDADYRGELAILLHNAGWEAHAVRRGDRVAQVAFKPVYEANLLEVESLSPTERGEGGFGSTGR